MGGLRSPHLQYSLIHSVVILGRGSSQISDLHLQSPISNVVILGRIQSDLRSPSPISNPQSRFGGPGEEGGSNLQGDALWIHSQCKRISTLFSRHFAISSRPTRSLGAFGAKSESPPLSQDLKRLHAPTRDLRLLSSIYTGEDLPPPILQSTAALGRRFATYEISKRHLRSTVQGSSDVAQRCPCMRTQISIMNKIML